jgi:hypothetical protein
MLMLIIQPSVSTSLDVDGVFFIISVDIDGNFISVNIVSTLIVDY